VTLPEEDKELLRTSRHNKESILLVLSTLMSRGEINQFIIDNHISATTAKDFLAGYILSRTMLKEQSIIEDEEEAMMLDEET
jgi:hypothetical protein